jgi:hypothetical protein
MAGILYHPVDPVGARFVVAITKVDDSTRLDTDELTRLLTPIPVVEVATMNDSER